MAKIKIKPFYVVIAIALIIIFLPGYAKFMELQAKSEWLEKEIERMEKENIRLYNEKLKLEKDINYIEKVARESLGLTREGEIPVKIEKESSADDTPQ